MNYLNYIKEKWDELLKEKVSQLPSEGEEPVALEEEVALPSEEEKPSVEKEVDATNPIIDELDKYIKEQYDVGKYERPELLEVPVYERMEAKADTDEEIEAKAKAALSEYENLSLNAIEDEISALEKQYERDKESAKNNYEAEERGLAEIYDKAKEGASLDMLKRGLARSSISANVVSSLEAELGEKRASALKGYIDSLSSIEEEISSLEAKRQRALNDFNISYVAKLTTEINKLTEQRDENLKEVLKYNNTLTEKEYSQAVQKELDESKLYSDELSQAEKERALGTLTRAQQEKIYENIYGKMDEVLGQLDAAEAKKLISDSNIFRQYLSDYYYYKLLDKYGR